MRASFATRPRDPRSAPRWRVEGRLPGRLIAATGQTVVPLSVNVSTKGLGITCHAKLPPGTTLMWVINSEVHKFSMVWCSPDEDRPGVHRYGFQAQSPTIDFDDIVRRHLEEQAAPSNWLSS